MPPEGKTARLTRLFEEERRRATDLALVNELGGLVSAQLELSAVLEAGAHYVARVSDVPDAFVVLLDADGSFVVRASTVADASVRGIRIAGDEPSAVRRAVEERRAVLVTDAENDPTVSQALRRRFGHRVVLALPMLARGQPIGAVLLGETRPGRGVSPYTVELAVTITNQLATAVANALLVEDLRQSYRDLEQAQRRLVQRERLAALGELSASVAHEVRNPLGVIFNTLGALRKLVPPDEDTRMLLDIAGEEADRINRIVGELIEFARPTEVRLAPTSVAEFVAAAVDGACMLASAPPQRVVLTLVPGLPEVNVDGELLRQALTNLLVNALQAGAEGRVDVRVSVEARGARPLLRIDVEDRGAGIPSDVGAQIWKPFFSTKARGTGLGLARVKRIAEAHHGDVAFASGDRGSVFTLRIPIDQELP